jgi:hypothetical protein
LLFLKYTEFLHKAQKSPLERAFLYSLAMGLTL